MTIFINNNSTKVCQITLCIKRFIDKEKFSFFLPHGVDSLLWKKCWHDGRISLFAVQPVGLDVDMLTSEPGCCMVLICWLEQRNQTFDDHLFDPETCLFSYIVPELLVIMVTLCNIFLPCNFYLSIYLLLFFPRLISAAVGWMSTIFWHMVWP